MLNLKSFLLILASVLLQTAAHAVPAKPGLIAFRQADGTEIMVRIVGDECFHYYLSEDNFLLVNDNDILYYGNVDGQGNIVRSQMKAEPAAMRSIEAKGFLESVDKDKVMSALRRQGSSAKKSPQRRNPGLASYSFPVRGDVKGLVVLVEYKDKSFTLPDPYDYFCRMMGETGFSDYGGTGCCEEYFRDQSKGVFRPQFDVYGPVKLSNNMSYYGGNDSNGDDKNPQKMAIEACQQLDKTVDFSQYDTNNDGYIDNIFVIYAGLGEASSGVKNTVWPHSWEISSAEPFAKYIFDGVRLEHYACSNEWEGTKPDGIGTFCHEFSHVMGLPDLYATDGSDAFTPGTWAVMDGGSYNNDSRTPPAYSIYERYSLGWIEPRVLDGPASVALEYIGESNEGCIIKTDSENEFFLLENRQQTGWDTYIPGHGMLVWHIDYDEDVWYNNIVNNNASHQYVDIEEADNKKSTLNRSGDAFPGTSNKTKFTDTTAPSMRTWAGERLNLPITDIAETDGVITFDIAGGEPTGIEAAIADDGKGLMVVTGIDGKVVYRGKPADLQSLDIPCHGLYIINVGGKAHKLAR